ncbi:MAG TPA: immunoglobulin domain-containing protein, partial [Verrucomicrobiae bacterium]|nr:immunoglobulin domain-containing protein [Verrucomicrobiae bacterium]
IKYCNINFQPANGSGIAAVAGSLGGTRVAQVAGGNLVFSDVGASIVGLYACPGLPNNTTASSSIIAEPGKPLDFAFSPDLNTVYISDNGIYGGVNVEAGGLQRWDASGIGTDGFPGYSYSYTLQMGTSSSFGGRAVTVDFSAATRWGTGVRGANIYVTTAETSGNRLLRIVDTGPASPSTTLVHAPTNEMLSGVRFGPVFVAPSFSIQPQSQTALFGSSVTFSAFAAGTGPLTYQWYFKSNGVGAFTAIAGATNDTYEINEAETNNLGDYYAIVTDPVSASAQSQTVSFSLPATSGVSLAVNTLSPGPAIPRDFLGLSFEEANLRSNGVGVVGYMFDSSDTELVTLFTNLGIKNLRIGGTSVDTNNEVIPVYIPTNQDVDALFRFAPAAGVEVSLSFRLENGNSQLDAALAAYTWSNYNQYLTCFEIGNEPDDYGNADPQITGFSSYLAKWTSFEQAILNAAPSAKFAGPDSAGTAYAGEFANAETGSTNITTIFSHFYAGGNSSSLTPAQIIAGMLSASWDTSTYPSHLNNTEAIANADGFPFRSTEFNSYVADYPGLPGGNNVFASALYACDAAHWWAANKCNGVNFHTFLGKYNATIYYDINGNYQIFPIGYGIKAFDLGSHGAIIPVTMTNTNSLNVTAYGVGSSNDLFVTIVNKEYGANPNNAAVTIIPQGISVGSVRAMFLDATNGVAATNGVTLGGAFITNNAAFAGQWTPLGNLTNGQCLITVPISSAAIVEIQPPPSVSITLQTLPAGQFQLNWNTGALQSAPTPAGPYTDLPGAASSWLITPTNRQQYYRVRAGY